MSVICKFNLSLFPPTNDLHSFTIKFKLCLALGRNSQGLRWKISSHLIQVQNTKASAPLEFSQ